MTKLEKAQRARDEAREKVSHWWSAGFITGHCREITQAPAWPEYLAACDAVDRAVEEVAR